MHIEVAERLRVTFAVNGPLAYISVLDMGRLWERLLRRAELPLAYSQGYNPQPRMQFAAALPVGYSSHCELVDIYLGEPVEPEQAATAMSAVSPPGLSVVDVSRVDIKGPTPQALMRSAEYRVALWSTASATEVTQALDTLLERESILRVRRKKKGLLGEYDLRALIYAITPLSFEDGRFVLHMHLRCGSNGAGRPEEILDELGLEVSRREIERTRLIWQDEEQTP